VKPDTVNGFFQLGGAVLEAYDVFLIRRDKMARGVHWSTVLFFVTWNLWSLYYYYQLAQWLSFAGDCVLSVASIWWLELLVKYRRR